MKDKRILIVGASSGLAVSLNKRLAGRGCILGLHYNSNKAALDQFKDPGACRVLQKDLKSEAACEELVRDFVKWTGGIDVLIQLSGNIARPHSWEKLTEADWAHDLWHNVTAPFYLARTAITHMKTKGGAIVLTSTASAAHGGGRNSLAYGCGKAALECVTKRLARDTGPYGIRVNAIAPGFIPTKFHTERMKRSASDLEERAGTVPLKRAGTPDEIAGVIEFLMSDAAKYVTGQVVAVSGGDWM